MMEFSNDRSWEMAQPSSFSSLNDQSYDSIPRDMKELFDTVPRFSPGAGKKPGMANAKFLNKEKKKKWIPLYKRKKSIQSRLKRVKNPELRNQLLDEKKKIEIEQDMKRIGKGLRPMFNTTGRGSSSSDGSDASQKENDSSSSSSKKAKNILLHNRSCIIKSITYHIISKTKKAKLQSELAKINAYLGLPNQEFVFDASDYYFAEQLFGKYRNVDRSSQFSDAQSYDDGSSLVECESMSSESYFNGDSHNMQSNFQYNVFDEVEPYENQEPDLRPIKNTRDDMLSEALASDCRKFLERLGSLKGQENWQSSQASRHRRRERSPNHSYYRGSSVERMYKEASPGPSYRERSPRYYREGSPSFSTSHRSPRHSYRGRSPIFDREKSPSFNRDRSPSEESTDIDHRDYSPHRERSLDPSHSDTSLGPSRNASPYRDFSAGASSRESFPYDSYDDRHEQIWKGGFQGRSQELRDDELNYENNVQGLEEEDLRVRLLRLREQRVEERLRKLEQESIETEKKLREIHEKRLTEEVDDFLREQSQYWRREDMKRDRPKGQSFRDGYSYHT